MSRGFVKSMAGLLLAAGVLALLGCGGDSGGSSLTKAEFTKKANELCKRGNEEREEAKARKANELKLKPGEIATPSEQKQVVLAAVVGYEKSTEMLKELIPSDQAERMEPVIKAREEVAEVVRTSTGLVKATFPAIKKANDLALQYGLNECSV